MPHQMKLLFVFWVVMLVALFAGSKARTSTPKTGCRPGTGLRRCIVCNLNFLNISCPAGKKIQIISALYGRLQPYSKVCHGSAKESTDCNGSEGVAMIMNLCQNKPHCSIPASLNVEDPCSKVDKYIDIDLNCSIPKHEMFLETVRHLIPDEADGFKNLENQIEKVSQNHIDTNGTTYDFGETQLHIVVSEITEERYNYNSILELRSSHIEFQLETNNVSRIVTTVFVYKINQTKTTETQRITPSSLAVTRYIAAENTTFIVINGWDADSFLRSSNDTAGNDQLQGNANLVVTPASSESVCKQIKKEKENSTNLMIRKLAPICLFVERLSKKYSDVGCVTSIDDVSGDVICKCNHLTIFTVLLAVETITIPEWVKIISYTTEAASIAFLIATIVILCIHQRHDDRNPVQISLSLAFLLLHATNMSHDLAVSHEISCMIFTVTVHYLLLCVGMWFLIEGVRLVMATSFPYAFEAQDPQNRVKVFMVVGWVVPALIVGVAAGVGFSSDSYMQPQPFFEQCNEFENQTSSIPKYDRCWLAPGTPIFYASVFAPLALILFMNTMIIVKTTHVMSNTRSLHNKDENAEVENALRAAKSFFLLLVMLGGTWSLVFFTGIGYDISNEVFMYINSLVNGSQGIVVFHLYCVMNRVTRQEILPCKTWSNEQQRDSADTGLPHLR